MATTGIPGLDVIEESRSRALRPSMRPNFTIPPGAPPAPSYPIATQPYRPNFDIPNTGARQPFNAEAPGRVVSPPGGVEDATVRKPSMRESVGRAVSKLPSSVQTTGKALMRGGSLLAAGSAIGDSTAPDSTARYAKRFGVDEPTGDGSVGDILKFSALRAGGFASDLGNTLTGGLAGRLFADQQPGAMPEPAQPAAPSLTGPSPQGQPGGTLPGAGVPVPPNPAGTIRRVGNSYSADGPIAFGATIDNPRNPGAGVTVLPAGPSMRGGFELPRSVTTGDGGSTLGQGPIAIGGDQGGDRDRQNREATFRNALSDIRNSNMKPRDKRAAMALAQEQYMGTQKLEGDQATARMRESGDMARANLGANVQRENNAAQRDLTLRGQDITREGQMVSAQGNRMRMQYDMAKDQRDFAAQRSDAAFTQGQQAIKDLHLEIGNMLPPTTDRDGKPAPDTENAARYATAMQAMVGRMGKTMKDVDARDKARFVAGMQLADVVNATATGGLTPWGTRAVQSSEPILAIRKLPNGDYQTNRVGVNGETEVIPGRYIEKEGSTLGFGGRTSNKFKALME